MAVSFFLSPKKDYATTTTITITKRMKTQVKSNLELVTFLV